MLLGVWVDGQLNDNKPIFQRGVTDKRGVRPTIAREGSKLDFVRRGPARASEPTRVTDEILWAETCSPTSYEIIVLRLRSFSQ